MKFFMQLVTGRVSCEVVDIINAVANGFQLVLVAWLVNRGKRIDREANGPRNRDSIHSTRA